jgi:hypothetical protein
MMYNQFQDKTNCERTLISKDILSDIQNAWIHHVAYFVYKL